MVLFYFIFFEKERENTKAKKKKAPQSEFINGGDVIPADVSY